MYQSTRISLLLLLTAVGLSTGCTSLGDWGKAKDYVEWPLSRFAKDYQRPQRIAVIWSPDVMTTPGQPAMRGFGGRLYFYNEKSVAVPVKGELMIYGYEEPAPNITLTSAPSPEKKTVPDKKFKFSPEQFAERFSKSDLGASYSIWIPWDEAGGNVKRVSLIPIFKMEGEQVVYGDPAELTLPGRTPEAVMARSQSYPAVNGIINGSTGTYQSMQAGMQKPMTQQAMLQSAGVTGLPMNNSMPQQPMNNYPQTVYPAGMPGSSGGPQPNQSNEELLNGVTAANYNTQVSYPGAVNQASFQGAGNMNAPFGNMPNSGLKTTTIQMPSRNGNRLGPASSVPMGNPNMGSSVNALTPTAQTMMQMQAAGIDPQTQAAMIGQNNNPGMQGMNPAQYGNMQMVNGPANNGQMMNGQFVNNSMNPQVQNGYQQPMVNSGQATSSPQLQQLPNDFGPRKRQARVR